MGAVRIDHPDEPCKPFEPGTPVSAAATGGDAFQDSPATPPSRRIPSWRSRPWRRRGCLLNAGICVAVVAGLAASTPFTDEDEIGDVWGFLRSLTEGIGSVRWQFIPLLATLTLMHYLFAAVALRAGAGSALRSGAGGGPGLRETLLVQFAAAAANRLTPPGIGGAAVNSRYLVRRGRPVAESVGIVAAVNLLGALADGLLFLVVLGIAWATRANGPPFTAVQAKVSRLARSISAPSHVAVWIAAIAAPLAIACWILVRWRTGRPSSRLRAPTAAMANGFAAATRIWRRPRDLATLLVASAGTTLVLAIAFGLSLMAVPHGPPANTFALLLAAYLVGAAAGSATPTPAGMGSTETALTAMLLAAGVTVSTAVQAVLLFRLLTFWAPVPVGIIAAGRLRRRKAL